MRASLVIALVSLAAACGPTVSSRTPQPMPAGGTFHGVWQSPQYGRMELCQSNGVVVGEYTKDERHGTIQGRVDQDTLRFEWTEEREMVVGRPNITRGHGAWVFTVGDDEHPYLLGEWGYDDDETGSGQWNATKLPGASPDNCYRSVRRRPTGTQNADEADHDDLSFSDEEDEG